MFLGIGLYLLGATITYVVYSVFLYPVYLNPFRHMPGPELSTAAYLTGNLSELMRNNNPVRQYRAWAKQYGKIYKYYFFMRAPVVFVGEPSAIKRVLKDNVDNYTFPKPVYGMIEKIFGQGSLLTVTGDVHRMQKKIVKPAFSYNRIKLTVPKMNAYAQQLVKIWGTMIDENENDSRSVPIDVLPFSVWLVFDIIMAAGFGVEPLTLKTNSATYLRNNCPVSSVPPSPLTSCAGSAFSSTLNSNEGSCVTSPSYSRRNSLATSPMKVRRGSGEKSLTLSENGLLQASNSIPTAVQQQRTRAKSTSFSISVPSSRRVSVPDNIPLLDSTLSGSLTSSVGCNPTVIMMQDCPPKQSQELAGEFMDEVCEKLGKHGKYSIPKTLMREVDWHKEFEHIMNVVQISPCMFMPNWLRENVFQRDVMRKYHAAKAKFTDLVEGIVQYKEQKRKQRKLSGKSVKRDILSSLMDSNTLSTEELRDNCMSFLVAGHETTARSLTWTLHLLAEHPEIQANLRDEINTYYTGEDWDYDSLEKLPYLGAVVKETLRLKTPVPVTARCAAEDDVLAGYSIPKGTWVVFSPQVMHLNGEAYTNADDFRPERWLGEEKASSKGDVMDYLPFSYGPKMCIGWRFASIELKACLAELVRAFRFKPSPGFKFEEHLTITLKPDPGMELLVERV